MAANFPVICWIFGPITTKCASTSVGLARPRTTPTSKASTARRGTNVSTCTGSSRLTMLDERSKLGGRTTTRVGLTKHWGTRLQPHMPDRSGCRNDDESTNRRGLTLQAVRLFETVHPRPDSRNQWADKGRQVRGSPAIQPPHRDTETSARRA